MLLGFCLVFSRVHATLQLALSVGWLVCHVLLFFMILFFDPLLLPKWSSDLKYGPCPPTRDLGSRVSGLVLFIYSFIIIFHFEVKNGME